MTNTVTMALDADIDELLARAKRLEVIVLENGGGKDATYGGLALMLVIAAMWLIVTGGLSVNGLMAAAGSGAFFAGLMVLFLRRWLVARARQLRVSPDAFEMATLTGYYTLPWSQVGPFVSVPAASIFPGRGDGKMIIFDLTPKPDARQRTDVFGIPLFPLGGRAGLSAAYGLTHADLTGLLQTYRNMVLHGSATPKPDLSTA